MKKEKEMDVIFLLDRSGSMSNVVEDTIGGFNSYLEKQKKNKYKTKVTTILFDDKYEVLYQRKPIKDVQKLTENEYYVRGCTALMDAIGKTINTLDKEVKDNKVLFVITTDGLENASHEYDKKKIKKLISKHNNWEFIYIGADVDSFSEASSIGIRATNTASYRKDKRGVGLLFDSIDLASKCLYEQESLSSAWKQDLDNYIENNQE